MAEGAGAGLGTALVLAGVAAGSAVVGASGELRPERLRALGGTSGLPEAGLVYLALRLGVLPLVAHVVGLATGASPEARLGLLLIAASPASPLSNLWQWISLCPTGAAVALTAVGTAASAGAYPLVLRVYAGALGAVVQVPYTSIVILTVVYSAPLVLCALAGFYWGPADQDPPAAGAPGRVGRKDSASAVLEEEGGLAPSWGAETGAGAGAGGGGAGGEAALARTIKWRFYGVMSIMVVITSLYFLLGKLGYVPQDDYGRILQGHGGRDWAAAAVFLAASYILGYFAPRAACLPPVTCRLVAMECGFQNEWVALLALKASGPAAVINLGFSIVAYACMNFALAPLVTLLNRYLHQRDQVEEYITENRFENSFKSPSYFVGRKFTRRLTGGGGGGGAVGGDGGGAGGRGGSAGGGGGAVEADLAQLSVQGRHVNAIQRIFGEHREQRYPKLKMPKFYGPGEIDKDCSWGGPRGGYCPESSSGSDSEEEEGGRAPGKPRGSAGAAPAPASGPPAPPRREPEVLKFLG